MRQLKEKVLAIHENMNYENVKEETDLCNKLIEKLGDEGGYHGIWQEVPTINHQLQVKDTVTREQRKNLEANVKNTRYELRGIIPAHAGNTKKA